MKNTKNQWLKILSLVAAGTLLMMMGYFYFQTETQPTSTELKIFPNPTSGPFTIQIKSEPLTTNIRLIDMNGKELLSEEVKILDGLYEQVFDLSNQPKGTYIFHCYQKGNLLTEPVVIQ